MKNSREMGTLRPTGRKDASGGTLVGVDIFMHRCAYLRSGSDQVFRGLFFRVERFGWHRDLDVKWDAYS